MSLYSPSEPVTTQSDTAESQEMDDNLRISPVDEVPSPRSPSIEWEDPLIGKIMELPMVVSASDWKVKGLMEEAVVDGHINALRLLKMKSANLCARDSDGWTLLHRAAEAGRPESILFLVEEGLHVNDRWSFWNRTPLHQAAEAGCLEAVEVLVFLGANVDVLDVWERSPLHLASRYGHIEVCSFLTLCGAGLTQRDGSGLTPVDYAIAFDRKQLIIFFYRALYHTEHCTDCKRNRALYRDPRLRVRTS